MRLCAHSHLPPEQKATPISTFESVLNIRQVDSKCLLWESESHMVGILATDLVVMYNLWSRWSGVQEGGRRSARRESVKSNFGPRTTTFLFRANHLSKNTLCMV